MNRSDSRITIRRIDIMPSIKQNTAQQRALVNISSQLDAVKSMNDILSGEAKDTFIGFPAAAAEAEESSKSLSKPTARSIRSSCASSATSAAAP